MNVKQIAKEVIGASFRDDRIANNVEYFTKIKSNVPVSIFDLRNYSSEEATEIKNELINQIPTVLNDGAIFYENDGFSYHKNSPLNSLEQDLVFNDANVQETVSNDKHIISFKEKDNSVPKDYIIQKITDSKNNFEPVEKKYSIYNNSFNVFSKANIKEFHKTIENSDTNEVTRISCFFENGILDKWEVQTLEDYKRIEYENSNGDYKVQLFNDDGYKLYEQSGNHNKEHLTYEEKFLRDENGREIWYENSSDVTYLNVSEDISKDTTKGQEERLKWNEAMKEFKDAGYFEKYNIKENEILSKENDECEKNEKTEAFEDNGE